MIDKKNKMLTVKNRSGMRVIYTIPNMNIRRDFAPGQEYSISYDELENLSFQPGGKTLMADYLLIRDPENLEYKNPTAEPEYYFTEEDIVDLLQNGSLDAFLDALDFAPAGVLDLIKEKAISLPLNDVAKREALKTKLHYDVDAVLKNSGLDSDEGTVAPETPTQRRVSSTSKKASSGGRRTTTKK